MINMPGKPTRNEPTVSTNCYQFVAGPDLLKVRVEGDVATEVTPNFDAATIHPAGGRVCVKAFGLVQKGEAKDSTSGQAGMDLEDDDPAYTKTEVRNVSDRSP
jgi:hypothetical protein